MATFPDDTITKLNSIRSAVNTLAIEEYMEQNKVL